MAKQSLAAQTPGALAGEFKLPGIFSAPQQPLVAKSFAAYISFAHHNKSEEWSKLTAKFGKVEEGDMFLYHHGQIDKLSPLKASLLCYTQFWAQRNPAGEVTVTSFKEAPEPFEERIEAVLLVYLGEQIIPANVEFRTTKCPAAHVLSEELAACQKPEWMDRSPAHKEASVIGQPFNRFYGLIDLGPQRTSKKSGRPYRPTTCAVSPTGVAEWRALKAYSENEVAQKEMELAASNYTSRMNDMKAKEAK